MSVEGLIAGAIITLCFAIWVLLPLFQRHVENVAPDDAVARQRERVDVYYARVLRNLHDIDEDHATGKLRPEDYEEEREAWVKRGVAALKALDKLDTEHLLTDADADDATIDEAIDSAIESAITSYRTQTESTAS